MVCSPLDSYNWWLLRFLLLICSFLVVIHRVTYCTVYWPASSSWTTACVSLPRCQVRGFRGFAELTRGPIRWCCSSAGQSIASFGRTKCGQSRWDWLQAARQRSCSSRMPRTKSCARSTCAAVDSRRTTSSSAVRAMPTSSAIAPSTSAWRASRTARPPTHSSCARESAPRSTSFARSPAQTTPPSGASVTAATFHWTTMRMSFCFHYATGVCYSASAARRSVRCCQCWPSTSRTSCSRTHRSLCRSATSHSTRRSLETASCGSRAPLTHYDSDRNAAAQWRYTGSSEMAHMSSRDALAAGGAGGRCSSATTCSSSRKHSCSAAGRWSSWAQREGASSRDA